MKHTLFAILLASLLSTQAVAEDTKEVSVVHYTRCAMLFNILGYSDGLHKVTLLMADRNFSEEAVSNAIDAEATQMEKSSTDEWTKVAVESCKQIGFGE
jgi:hypothetical protein